MTIYTISQAASAASAAPAVKTAAAAAPATTATTTAPAAPGAPAGKPQKSLFGEGLSSMLPFIIIMGVFIYLMWSSQRKERKKKEELLSSIKVGSEVVTIGGIMGTIDTVKEDHFIVKISENAKIKVLKNAVSQVVSTAEPAKK